jgi:hypothetical protein
LGVVVFDPFLAGFVFLFVVPDVRAAFGVAKHFVEGLSHFELETLEPDFDLSFRDEVFAEADLFLVFGVHSVGDATELIGIR